MQLKIYIGFYFLTLSLLLSACSGPQYTKPPVNVPTHWTHQNTTTHKKVNLAELAWWQQFQNPELNQLIQTGLRQNNQVSLALANLEYAKAQLKQVKLAWLPGINL